MSFMGGALANRANEALVSAGRIDADEVKDLSFVQVAL